MSEKKKPKNPKQRLILYYLKDFHFGNVGMFVKTLERAQKILLGRNKANLKRAVFYDREGVATEFL